MKKIIVIPFIFLLIQKVSAGKLLVVHEILLLQPAVKDTLIEDIEKEDEIIDEILKTRTKPKDEKIKYFNQVTKYGFKNLFSNYSYNATIPYTAQVNPNAGGFVQDYMRKHGSYLQKMKGWGLPYFNLIENVLQQYGLPKELKYIAVIESNLSSDATSWVGAGGPWQFMPYTARDYGLVVNSYVDERRDYYKSTHAAARYLLSLYKQMHDWLLVMAAYNGGPGRVYSAIKKSGSRNFWDLQYYLPEESRTYVKRFIATHYIMEGTGGVTTNGGYGDISNMNDFGFENTDGNTFTTYGTGTKGKNPFDAKPKLTSEELVDVEVLPLSGRFNSMIIAKNLTMNIAEFNHYNPGFDAGLKTNGSFDLRLPPEKMQLFVANKYQILNESVQVLLGSASIPETKTAYPKTRLKR